MLTAWSPGSQKKKEERKKITGSYRVSLQPLDSVQLANCRIGVTQFAYNLQCADTRITALSNGCDSTLQVDTVPLQPL